MTGVQTCALPICSGDQNKKTCEGYNDFPERVRKPGEGFIPDTGYLNTQQEYEACTKDQLCGVLVDSARSSSTFRCTAKSQVLYLEWVANPNNEAEKSKYPPPGCERDMGNAESLLPSTDPSACVKDPGSLRFENNWVPPIVKICSVTH